MSNKPWLEIYASGIPANVDYEKYDSLHQLLKESFDKYRDNVAYTFMGKEMTFHEIEVSATYFAAYLQSRGLVPGDKIAIVLPNILQYPIAAYAAFKAGLVLVNTNPLYTAREMKHQFVDSDAKAIVILENFAAEFEKIAAETDISVVITTKIGELLGTFKGMLVNFGVKYIKRMVPNYDLVNSVSFSEALTQGKKFKVRDVERNPDDVIILQYTGGTTGVSKGAMLTNRNMIANGLQVKEIMNPYLEAGNENALCALPLYHIFAFTVNFLTISALGMKNILIPNARDINSLVKAFKKEKISLFPGLNTLFNALLNNEKFKECDFSTLKVTVGGGMAVQKSVAIEWKKVTGCVLSEGYGLTEASPVVTVNPFNDDARLGTIGIPIPSTDVRILGENGEILGYNQIGELATKGPQVMKGYYKRPDETEKVLDHEGWLKTGDMAIMEPDGFVQIVDRKKDMILVSGFNVYPNEVEDVIAMHPKVLEVAAIGVPDEHSSEVVKIFVVKKEKSLTEKELKTYAREYLTGYKRPKYIEFRSELPKSNVGKILRKELRDEENAKDNK
ncbi:AMP-binding protein [Membranicola marinus]|uniref:Long-chain-fatty-acid--CoA ligase n=1 Tax=Membranihabitans marinus TaxID=1227546 RepID=A0A953HIW4_9BACT|nr:AMP-binding protein [Membranihabitans marinus]MBY5956527.1 AMP-binding protein [Membranihabitans marinus]